MLSMRQKNKIISLSVILIISLVLFVYFNSLTGKFLWDDDVLVNDNVYIRNWSALKKIFTKDIGAGGAKEFHAYRPIQIFTYLVDYSLWRLNVKGYHLTNILLHILVTLAIYSLLNILYGDRFISLLTSVLFAVHPIHTEAVAYISGRADSLAALFMVFAFIFYIKYLRSNKITTYLVILLSYLFAVLSKESSLILPLLFLLYHYAFKVKFKIKQFLPVLFITFLYVLLRLTVFKTLLPPPQSLVSAALFQRLPGFFVALINYTKLLFLPLNLHMEYGYRLFNLSEPKAILGGVGLIFLLSWVYIRRKNNKLLFFSISWFFLSLLPQSNIYSINAYMAEHWLYLPSVGFFLILAKGLAHLYKIEKLKNFAAILLIGLLTFYSFLTIKQNTYWKNPIVFYERNLKYAPDSARMLNNLAQAYKDIGKYPEAGTLFKKSIELSPGNEDTYNNFALLYHDTGDYTEAIALYNKAIELNPNNAKVYNNLANAYKQIGKPQEAIALYKKAIQTNPDYATAYNNLGIVLCTAIGKKEEAIAVFKEALRIIPDFADVHNNLAVSYYYGKQYDLAIKHCDRAINLGYEVNPEFLKLLEPYRKQGYL